ncbi:hypothetical protein ACFQU7_18525 [Pseudoroseomonas wenyumeiae]
MPEPSVTQLELASHSAVPAARTGFDGPLLLRAFLGGTGRANATSSCPPRRTRSWRPASPASRRITRGWAWPPASVPRRWTRRG